jgi:uncharacterized protein (DUF1778 family)
MKPDPDTRERLPVSEDVTTLVLSKEESERLAELILNPPEPNEALKKLLRNKD